MLIDCAVFDMIYILILQEESESQRCSVGFGQNGQFDRSEMWVHHFGNWRNHEYWGFEVSVKVRRPLPTAIWLEEMVPSSQAVLEFLKP